MPTKINDSTVNNVIYQTAFSWVGWNVLSWDKKGKYGSKGSN